MVTKRPKLTDDERASMIELIRSGVGRREVARQTKRSTTTVTRVAAEIGWDWLAACDARTQSSLARAHEARTAYSAEERAVDAAGMQQRIKTILAGFDDEREVTLATGKGVRQVMAKPDWRAVESLSKAINTLQRTVLDIKRADDQGDGHAEARGLLERIVESLEAA